MAGFDRQQELEKKELREAYDRVTAVSHIQIEHFTEHKKIEGYHENPEAGHLFSCDRLMKREDMFGRIQMGYNPNRGRSFIFANIKTSRYDTASSSIQREMNEYESKSLLKGENENRVFVSKHRSNVTVLLEKSENKPWTQKSIRPYMNRANLETLKKVMPFLNSKEESGRLEQLKQEQKQLRDSVSEHSRKGEHDQNAELRQKQIANLEKENMLESMIYRKEMGSRLFFRKINYAFDFQKHDMFEYYREQRNARLREMEGFEHDDDEEDGSDS